MLQNARVTAFTVSELLSEYQKGEWVNPPLPSPYISVKLTYNY